MADLHAAVAGYVEAHVPKPTAAAPSVDEAAAAMAEEMEAGRGRSQGLDEIVDLFRSRGIKVVNEVNHGGAP